MEVKKLGVGNTTSSITKHFVLARLHSLAGLIPLGLFLIEHFYTNATAILGADTYNRQIAFLHNIPFVLLIEIFFIAIPLIFHAVYGMYLTFISRNNTLTYSYRRNWLFFFQRITGIVTLIFVVYHIWALRISNAISGTEVSFQVVSEHLQNPWIFAFYVVGIIATTYHFANGISTGLITWGITIGKASQKMSSRICLGVFILMTVIGIMTLFAFV
ncbi:succinate dehydrogenase cytochrome b558 subunit [Halalkalibacter nanhaiisediminis]|uniref:Succinate dehydrogenase subunit C n=1 Tax=Halalkalibacter nanhaiisediminis TaxID=688079 RepID=A0A562QMX9_9BACI|nr:succinate dehydrogenase cytochrome b558 subunit [Halalkalibacter nanhaiisediminis]TWI58112.1 succinate dehydrogenase subunit C [Halalkalibacter nanhaiisediminis]